MYYRKDKVRLALRHFLIGKAATAVSALILLLVLARTLPQAVFAAYVSLQAIIVVVGALTSFGINQALTRFGPELVATGQYRPLFQKIFDSIGSRALVTAAGLIFILALLPIWTDSLQIQLSKTALVFYLLVGWSRLMQQFLTRVLESLLWHRLTQTAVAVGSISKMACISSLAVIDDLNLGTVFVIEFFSESLTLLILLVGLFRRWRLEPLRYSGSAGWWQDNRRRVSHFSRWAYLNSLTTTTYGSAPNRLIAARFLTPETTAIFGFADAIALLAKRFMPARLAHSLIKPVLIARHTDRNDFRDLNLKVNLNFRLNSVLLCGPVAVLLVVGPALLDAITADKYGPASPVLTALLAILLLDGFRTQVELACEVVERPQLALAGNLAMSLSLLLALVTVSLWGIWGILSAAAVAELTAIGIMVTGLRRRGFPFVGDRLMLNAPVSAIASVILGWVIVSLATSSTATTFAAGLVTCAAYLTAAYIRPAFSQDELKLLRSMRKRS